MVSLVESYYAQPCHTFGTHREIPDQLTGSIFRMNLQAGITVSNSLRYFPSVCSHRNALPFFLIIYLLTYALVMHM